MPAGVRFQDRRDAGRQLADHLAGLDLVDPVVFALPRGGVPVGYEVALLLDAPLDVLVARKIGAPFQPELGVGAIAEDGVTVLDEGGLAALGLTVDDLADTVREEQQELRRRVAHYRGDRAAHEAAGHTVVVVDDGLATGVTARAALRSLRRRNPARLLLAVPVGPPTASQIMRNDADEVVCVQTPERLAAIGQWYRDFAQTPDETVVELLAAAQRR